MMYFSKADIKEMEKVYRLNLVNSLTGIKPANLIGTISEEGMSNLAIISSVVHLGSNPALFGFIMRPSKNIERHTFDNIIQTQSYTINHVIPSHIRSSHYTSARFERTVSEFSACGFSEEYLHDFLAPYVKECHVKLGMSLEEIIDIPLNETKMIIGKVEHVYLPQDGIDEEGKLNLEHLKGVGISGLNSYYSLSKIGEFPYARVSDWATIYEGKN